jgi:bifunctional non-homologous end joining protein LigD
MSLLPISHPEKILFPDCGVTKGELCRYYEQLAPVMLPHLSGRPITLERFPAGIEQKGFIQKEVSKGFPEWLSRVEVRGRARRVDGAESAVHYSLAREARDLVWMANQNAVTLHVWASRVPALDTPDCCVFDLDPTRENAAELARAALAVRDSLGELGLSSFVKTSGSKGFHIFVALDGSASFDSTWRFGLGVGALLVRRFPGMFTQEFIKADRAGRIFVDTGRNGRGATFAAAYTVRAKPGAPVSAPCSWAEVESGSVAPQTFTLRTMPERLARSGDMWSTMVASAHSLEAPLLALEALLSEADWKEAHDATTRRPVSRKRPRNSR